MTTIDNEALVTATGGLNSGIATTRLPDPQHWVPRARLVIPPPGCGAGWTWPRHPRR